MQWNGDNETSLEPKLSVIPHTFVKRRNSDAKIKFDFEAEHFKNAYIDEYTGEVLQYDLIKEAIIEAVSYTHLTLPTN